MPYFGNGGFKIGLRIREIHEDVNMDVKIHLKAFNHSSSKGTFAQQTRGLIRGKFENLPLLFACRELSSPVAGE
jgi:hypothetical protein